MSTNTAQRVPATGQLAPEAWKEDRRYGFRFRFVGFTLMNVQMFLTLFVYWLFYSTHQMHIHLTMPDFSWYGLKHAFNAIMLSLGVVFGPQVFCAFMTFRGMLRLPFTMWLWMWLNIAIGSRDVPQTGGDHLGVLMWTFFLMAGMHFLFYGYGQFRVMEYLEQRGWLDKKDVPAQKSAGFMNRVVSTAKGFGGAPVGVSAPVGGYDTGTVPQGGVGGVPQGQPMPQQVVGPDGQVYWMYPAGMAAQPVQPVQPQNPAQPTAQPASETAKDNPWIFPESNSQQGTGPKTPPPAVDLA